MTRIGLFYGGDTGSTRKVAREIKKYYDDATMTAPIDVSRARPEDILSYDRLILGTSTIGSGELPGLASGAADPSWAEMLNRLAGTDLHGKTVAVFGLGDQFCYGETYVDGMGELAEFFADHGATVVGAWPTEGYDFEESTAVHDGKFVGLALDEDNQPDRTQPRVQAWLATIGKDFGL